MEPKTGKQIVSKGAYVVAQTNRATFSLLGVGWYLAAIVFGVIAGVCGICSLLSVCEDTSIAARLIRGTAYLFVAVGSGVVAYLFGLAGTERLQDASKMNNLLPLTRANTTNLPAQDTLVRASSEPMQAQEAVLLRPADANESIEPQELLRASH